MPPLLSSLVLSTGSSKFSSVNSPPPSLTGLVKFWALILTSGDGEGTLTGGGALTDDEEVLTDDNEGALDDDGEETLDDDGRGAPIDEGVGTLTGDKEEVLTDDEEVELTGDRGVLLTGAGEGKLLVWLISQFALFELSTDLVSSPALTELLWL